MSIGFYDGIYEGAKSLLREVLEKIEKNDLSGEEHFYVTCWTGSLKGLPESVRESHPDKIVLVLQHDFEDLRVGEEEISVGLRFNHSKHTVLIPFSAILSIADPSCDFVLSVPRVPNRDDMTPQPNIISFDSIKKK